MAEETKADSEKMLLDLTNTLTAIADSVAAIGAGQKALVARMDSMEEEAKAKADGEDDGEIKEKGDPKEVAADDDDDDARKDSAAEKGKEGYVSDDDDDDDAKADKDMKADEDKKEEAKADANSARIAQLEAALAAVTAQMTKREAAIRSDSEREMFAAIQEMAEPSFQAFGDRAPAALEGETPMAYKRRLGKRLQKHSPKWKETRLSAIADEAAMDTILADVYADSIAAARTGGDVPAGKLMPVISRSDAGHTRITYRGEPGSWMDSFKAKPIRA